ncbi:MAG: PspC domain-containing protein [Firmicutes bacterium]|nr:PspC domain-containing protein [Bacillota bacterium]
MKRLYRSRTDKMLFGVAGGIAKYFEVDVVLVRLLWVLAILAGPGVPAYIIAAIIIPEEPKSCYPTGGRDAGRAPAPKPAEQAAPQATPDEGRPEDGAGPGDGQDGGPGGYGQAGGREVSGESGGSSSRLFGYVLILLGAYFLARAVLPGWWWAQFWWIRPDHLWPLILVAIGIAIILRRQSR